MDTKQDKLKALMGKDWSEYGDRARREAFWILMDMAKDGGNQYVSPLRDALHKLEKEPVVGTYQTQEQQQYQHELRDYHEWQDGCRDCRNTPPDFVDMTPKNISGAEEAASWHKKFADAAPEGSAVKKALVKAVPSAPKTAFKPPFGPS